jgi:CRISPR/Cas system CSM-associated protein Csm4 (group 5 of RAMP superfamily)
MITINKNNKTRNTNEREYILVEISGLSTDTKPTVFTGDRTNYVDNGSIFIEVDTGKLFIYDLENEQWGEI